MKSQLGRVIIGLIVVLYTGRGLVSYWHLHDLFTLTAGILFSFAVLLTVSLGFIGKTDSNSLPKKPSP
jgi:ABC-type uncharacterized transport system permease subunit